MSPKFVRDSAACSFLNPEASFKRKPRSSLRLALLLFVLFCSACESIGYYTQAFKGQLSLISQRQSIESLLRNPAADAGLTERLEEVQLIREFAEQSLSLPVGKSYSSYVDLKRDAEQNYVVWNVFAAPEFSLEGRTWCYPLIGCAKYRGYFSLQAANRYAAKLQQQGMDTFVGGVTAYSTLGWLNDPVLSTFVEYNDASLAALLFHELAHKILYIAGDTEFNESFATAVAEEGLKRWLQRRAQEHELQAYQSRTEQRDFLLDLVEQYRESLSAVYIDSRLSDIEKRQKKQQLLLALQNAGAELSHPGYLALLKRLNNNASLIPLRSYHRWVPAFSNMLADQTGDLSSFYQQVLLLSELPKEERLIQLQKLTDRAAIDVQESNNGR